MNTKLYYHKTDRGAEYLSDRFIECPNGHKEGVFDGANILVRLDGQPEVMLRAVNIYADLLQLAKEIRALIRLAATGGVGIDWQDKLPDIEAAIAKAEANL